MDNLKQKLESLPLPQLKEMAKSLGLKGVSTMKKAAVIDLLMAQEEKNGSAETAAAQKAKEHSDGAVAA